MQTQEVEQLLWKLLAIDNAERNKAEQRFGELKQSFPNELLTALMTILHTSSSSSGAAARTDDIRSLAAILLRRVLLREQVSLWDQISGDTQRLLQHQLVQVLAIEQTRSIRRKVCDTVGELACELLEHNEWPELVPTLLQWVHGGHDNVMLRETALRVFEMITGFIATRIVQGNSSGDHHLDVEHVFLQVMEQSVVDEQGRVALNAIRAFGMLVIQLDSMHHRFQQPPQRLDALMHQSCNVLQRLVATNCKWDEVQELVEVWIEMMESHPQVFTKNLQRLVHQMVQLASPLLKQDDDHITSTGTGTSTSTSTVQVPIGCRQLAMELLVCAAENAPRQCRRLPGPPKNFFVDQVYPLVFAFMLELDEDETGQWSVTNWDDEDAFAQCHHEISNFDVGSEALERLVVAIGRQRSLHKCLELIQTFACHAHDWVYRHASLVGLCQILEILPGHSRKQLDPIVQHLFQQCQDHHPRVACTAIDVLGQMCVDQAPTFQEWYHQQAMQILVHFLDQTDAPRLQAHAATALRQFVDMCTTPTLLEPYVDQLLTSLFGILTGIMTTCQQRTTPTTTTTTSTTTTTTAVVYTLSERVVLEQVIAAVSSIATCSGLAFTKYYDSVVPCLKQILMQALEETHHVIQQLGPQVRKTQIPWTLCGISLECLSLIGCAVGVDTFGQDAVQIMDLMGQIHNTPRLGSHELVRTYLLQAYSRFCKCLGKEFVVYLPHVMPSLLFSATQQAEFELTSRHGVHNGTGRGWSDEEDELEDEEDEEEDDVEIAQVNDKRVSIRTSILEEKTIACQLLVEMIDHLEDAFFPYVEQVTQLLAPLMTDSVHSDIRLASIHAMPVLVKCVTRHWAVVVATTTNGGPQSSVNDLQAIKQLLDFALGRLLNALTTESDVDLVVAIMQSMKLCLVNALLDGPVHPQRGGPQRDQLLLNEAQLMQLVHGLLMVLADSFQRRALRRAQQTVDDAEDLEQPSASHDHHEFDDQQEEDEHAMVQEDLELELQMVLADCVGHLAKSHGPQFYNVFEQVLYEKLVEMTKPHCLPEDRKLALYILDDVLEYCGAQAMQQMDKLLPLLLECLQPIASEEDDDDDDKQETGQVTNNNATSGFYYPPLVQAACFGIGVCARLGLHYFHPYARVCLDTLGQIIQKQSMAQSPSQISIDSGLDMTNAVDNAIAAFGLICEFHASSVDATALFPQWLRMLPLRGDLEESVEVIKRLCGLVRTQQPLVIGHDGEQLPGIVAIFGEVVAHAHEFESQVGPEKYQAMHQQIALALQQIRALLPPQVMQTAWTTLTPLQQTALHAMFA